MITIPIFPLLDLILTQHSPSTLKELPGSDSEFYMILYYCSYRSHHVDRLPDLSYCALIMCRVKRKPRATKEDGCRHGLRLGAWRRPPDRDGVEIWTGDQFVFIPTPVFFFSGHVLRLDTTLEIKSGD